MDVILFIVGAIFVIGLLMLAGEALMAVLSVLGPFWPLLICVAGVVIWFEDPALGNALVVVGIVVQVGWGWLVMKKNW